MNKVKDKNNKNNKINKNSKKLLNILLSLVIIYTTFTIFGIKMGGQYITYFKENGETIIILSVILFTIIVYFSIIGYKFNKNKEFKKQIVVETFEDMNKSLCDTDIPKDKINDNCKKLTKDNCNLVDCCVLLDGNKCVGGSKDGPTYVDTDYEYYHHKNKCNGKCM